MFPKGFAFKNILLPGSIFILLLFAAGCLIAYVDPGPNPAKLTVSLKAAVPKDAVENIKRQSLRSVTGPYWVWWVYLVDGKGLYQDLKPEGEGPKRWQRAYSIDESATFLVRPGNYRVRLRVTAYLDQEWQGGDRGGTTIKSVPIADWQEDIMLKVEPGGSQSYSKDFGMKIE